MKNFSDINEINSYDLKGCELGSYADPQSTSSANSYCKLA